MAARRPRRRRRRRRSPGSAPEADITGSTYLAALRILARREVSESQLRLKLSRRGCEPGEIERAIERLRADRSLDDARTARAIARNEALVRHRGRLRVRRRIEAAGIAPAVAQGAVEEVFGDIDADALLASALERRLRGRTHVADDREHQRLYRYLIGQGFEHDRVLAALRARRGPA